MPGLRGAVLGAGVQVASRRVARGGSSRTVFRDGLLVRPGDTGHTDTRLNSVPALPLPAGPVTAITAEPAPGATVGSVAPFRVPNNRLGAPPLVLGGARHNR